MTPFNQLYGITAPVANLTRVALEGSTSTPSSWVRLTIDPTDPRLWSFETVPVAFSRPPRYGSAR